ncbi:MAG: hypothetical protein WC314_22405 [Vulcanimicrobiota bacterium]
MAGVSNTNNNALAFKIFAFLGFLALLLLGYWYYKENHTYRFPPGREQAPRAPVQRTVDDKVQWSRNGYLITALAEWDMEVRVIIAERYRTGREADLSPMDFTVAWGPASDTLELQKCHFYKLNRYYRCEWSDPTVDGTMMLQHTANMHMIGVDEAMDDRLKKVRREDIVTIKGYLVRVDAPDGWHWKSSLSRTDSGNGACELILVSELKVR